MAVALTDYIFTENATKSGKVPLSDALALGGGGIVATFADFEAETPARTITTDTLKDWYWVDTANRSLSIGEGTAILGADVVSFGHNANNGTTIGRLTAMGSSAMAGATGLDSTAFGFNALLNNEGDNCAAFGDIAGRNNTGVGLTAVGRSCARDQSGLELTAYGFNAGALNSGDNCTLIGRSAGVNNDADDCIFIGDRVAGVNNAFSNCVVIGVSVSPTMANQVRLGNTSTEQIRIDGILKGPYVTTASLPAAAGWSGGTVVTSDNGPVWCNNLNWRRVSDNAIVA